MPELRFGVIIGKGVVRLRLATVESGDAGFDDTANYFVADALAASVST